jgi:hypothetical protein
MSKDVADRLLDAQVAWAIEQLSGERLVEVLARDVDDLLALAADLTVTDVVDAEQVKGVLRRSVERIGAGPILEDLVVAFSDALYELAAGEEHRLGEVVGRDPVEALIEKVLSMPRLHDRAMERMAESPLVATVAARFVSKIVSDFVAQNRQLAEKLPGAKSLFSLGTSAANRVRNVSIIGDAAERGTQMAIRRTNSAMKDLIKEAPLKGAALEIWDLHADEPVSELRKYMSRQDLRELALIVHEILVTARSTDYVSAALDECVEVFFERYGARPLASLLPELGVTRDDIVSELQQLVPPMIEAAAAQGRLDALVRARLAPFFASAEVRAILAGEAPAPARKPAPAAKKAAAPKAAPAAKKAAPKPAKKAPAKSS